MPRYITPKFENIISAVVLSANDVVATVFILDVDEDGISIKMVADVDLPFEAQKFREKNAEGKSMFQRGDVIQIRCGVSKKGEEISDDAIEKMLAGLFDMEDENAELYDRINEDAKKFVIDWNDLCKRDLEKRRAGF